MKQFQQIWIAMSVVSTSREAQRMEKLKQISTIKQWIAKLFIQIIVINGNKLWMDSCVQMLLILCFKVSLEIHQTNILSM